MGNRQVTAITEGLEMGNHKLEQMQKLKTGKGIQYLLNKAYQILGNPLLMHDLDFQMMSCTENIITDDPLWSELVTTGRHSEETQRFMRDEGLFDIVANTETIALLTSENLKYERIFGKISNKDSVMVACVDLVACNQPIDDDDPAAFDELCDLLTKEISRSEWYHEYGKIYQETIINRLIGGNVQDKELYCAYVAIIYKGFKDRLHLAVADIARCDQSANPVYFRDLFKATQPECKYAIYGNHIVFIISTDDDTLNVNKDLGKLNRLFKKNNIYAGVSSSFDNLYELPKYYQEAVDALNERTASGERQWIFLYGGK